MSRDDRFLGRSAGMLEYIVRSGTKQSKAMLRQLPLLHAAMDRKLVRIEDVAAAAIEGWWPARFSVAQTAMMILEAGGLPPDEVLDWLAHTLCEYCDLSEKPIKATMEPVPEKMRRAMNAVLAEDVESEEEAQAGADRLPGDPSPRARAMEIVAERYGLGERQVENRLADFRRLSAN